MSTFEVKRLSLKELIGSTAHRHGADGRITPPTQVPLTYSTPRKSANINLRGKKQIFAERSILQSRFFKALWLN
jgi:hypothetical protein